MRYQVILVIAVCLVLDVADAGAPVSRKTISDTIAKEAVLAGLDSRLAIAVATVESGLRPTARGKAGEIGLFQLMPNQRHTYDIYTINGNIKEGIRQLLYWRAHCPVRDTVAFVSCFNQGARKPHYPYLLPYVRRVTAQLAVMK